MITYFLALGKQIEYNGADLRSLFEGVFSANIFCLLENKS